MKRTYFVSLIPLLFVSALPNKNPPAIAAGLVPRTGFEPAHLTAPPPEDGASTNFATWARGCKYKEFGFFDHLISNTTKLFAGNRTFTPVADLEKPSNFTG